MKSTAHTSFSILGLSITFMLGGAIILLEFAAEPLLRRIQRRRKYGLYNRLEWVTNETLQLQRIAHEQAGAGQWTGATENVPTTIKGEPLAILDISDETHPRFTSGTTNGDEMELRISDTGQYHSSMETVSVDAQGPHRREQLHESPGPLQPRNYRPDIRNKVDREDALSPQTRLTCSHTRDRPSRLSVTGHCESIGGISSSSTMVQQSVMPPFRFDRDDERYDKVPIDSRHGH